MEQQLETLKMKVKKSYGDKEFQKYPYNLHSICIHDGNATTGHYYSFVYDSLNNRWIKYSDIKIQEANQIALKTLQRALAVAQLGSYVLIENPLMSYLWQLDEYKAAMAVVGFSLVRIDQCTVGTPYQKPQL